MHYVCVRAKRREKGKEEMGGENTLLLSKFSFQKRLPL